MFGYVGWRWGGGGAEIRLPSAALGKTALINTTEGAKRNEIILRQLLTYNHLRGGSFDLFYTDLATKLLKYTAL